MNKGLLAAVIAAVSTILVSLIPIYCSNPGKHSNDSRKVIAGMITEGDTSKPIGQAQITIVGRNESDISQDNGNFRIFINDDKATTIKVIITKKGYKPVNLSFDLPDENVQIKMVRGD